MSRRDARGLALGVLIGSALAALLTRACERVVPDVGPRVEVVPSIRAWDAGRGR